MQSMHPSLTTSPSMASRPAHIAAPLPPASDRHQSTSQGRSTSAYGSPLQAPSTQARRADQRQLCVHDSLADKLLSHEQAHPLRQVTSRAQRRQGKVACMRIGTRRTSIPTLLPPVASPGRSSGLASTLALLMHHDHKPPPQPPHSAVHPHHQGVNQLRPPHPKPTLDSAKP
jgi:hypothetical protein